MGNQSDVVAADIRRDIARERQGGMAVHELKIDDRWFPAVAAGMKTVELRREDDRTFGVGDVLDLRERETGRVVRVVVTHILRHADAPDLLPPGVAALSIWREDADA